MHEMQLNQRNLPWQLSVAAVLGVSMLTVGGLQLLLSTQAEPTKSALDQDRERKWQIRSLCLAPLQDDFAQVDRLLNDLQDPKPTDDFVSMAAGARNIRIIEVLLRHGYTIDGPRHDNAPVFLAAQRDSEYVVSYLLQKGASLRTRPPKTDSPLASVVTTNRLNMVLTVLAN
jgi:hypothetical protein